MKFMRRLAAGILAANMAFTAVDIEYLPKPDVTASAENIHISSVTGEFSEDMNELPDIKTLIAKAAGFVFGKDVSDIEIMEIQQAYLEGIIPDELIGNVDRDITEGEYRRLLKATGEYLNFDIKYPDNFDRWVSSGSTKPIKRLAAANDFISTHMNTWGHDWTVNILKGVGRANMYTNGPAECVDPEYFGGQEDDHGSLMFFTHNIDPVTGAPLMDRDMKGYLRVDDNLTVKEAIQLVTRYIHIFTVTVPEKNFVPLSEVRTPLVLSEEELAAAAKMPEPTYEWLPAYQGCWYVSGASSNGVSDYVLETEFSTISEMGFNFMRYNSPRTNFMNESGNIDKEMLAQLDKAVRLAIKYGIHLRVDLGDNGVLLGRLKGGVTSDGSTSVDGFGKNSCTAQEYRDYIKSIYAAVAARYKNVPNSILSIHLFVEPLTVAETEGTDKNVTHSEYPTYVYMLADAIWAEDDDRLIATDGAPWAGYPNEYLAEEGIKRNLTSNGKERRILQNFHFFSFDFSWTNGFYGEMPSLSSKRDYVPPCVSNNNTITVKANSDGFNAGTTVNVKDQNRNVGYLKLTTYKNGDEVEAPVGAARVNNGYILYTLKNDADTLVFTNTGATGDCENSLEYIWITYPEKADSKIPIFGFFTEDGSACYGDGRYEEFAARSNGITTIREIGSSEVLYFTDKKTTHIRLGGDGQGFLNTQAVKDGMEPNWCFWKAEPTVQINDGNDNLDYTATFTKLNSDDKTVYRFDDDDMMRSLINVWTEFAQKYNTVPMQNEMGPNNGSRKEVIYAYEEFFVKAYTEAGWPWGGVCFNLGANGSLIDDYIYQGDYVKYDFHRTDATQLALYQSYMTRFDIDEIGHLPYTGEKQEPVLNVKYKGAALELGKDYKVTYHDSVEPGVATAVVTGLGEYAGIFTSKRYYISIFESEPIIDGSTAGDVVLKAGDDYFPFGKISETFAKITELGKTAPDNEYVIYVNVPLASEKKFDVPAKAITITAQNEGSIQTEVTSVAVKCDLVLNCPIICTKSGKTIAFKVAKDKTLTLGKAFASLGAISGTKTSRLIVNDDISVPSIATFGNVTANGTITIGANGKFTAISELNGNVILSTNSTAAIINIGTANITLVQNKTTAKLPKAAISAVTGELNVAVDGTLKAEDIILTAGKTDIDTTKIKLPDTEFCAYLYKKNIVAEKPDAMFIGETPYPSFEKAFEGMTDTTENYTLTLNDDISASKLVLPKQVGSLTINGGKEIIVEGAVSFKTSYPLTIENTKISAVKSNNLQPVTITANKGLTLKDIEFNAKAVTVKGKGNLTLGNCKGTAFNTISGFTEAKVMGTLKLIGKFTVPTVKLEANAELTLANKSALTVKTGLSGTEGAKIAIESGAKPITATGKINGNITLSGTLSTTSPILTVNKNTTNTELNKWFTISGGKLDNKDQKGKVYFVK